MRDFWHDSGYHLLAPTAEGRLAVSDDFLRAYLLRPEIRPVEDSCAAERALHVHGGYGVSLEYDIQLYYRRAAGWILQLGDPSDEYAWLADRTLGPRRTAA